MLEMLANKHRFQDMGKIVHIGIIDFLNRYTLEKKLERLAKSIKTDPATLSTADHITYSERFQTWITNNVLKN